MNENPKGVQDTSVSILWKGIGEILTYLSKAGVS